MAGQPEDEDDGPERIAAELKRLAERVRQGPFEPTEKAELIAEIEALARRFSRQADAGPAISRHLELLAEELRNIPAKRKNGPTA